MIKQILAVSALALGVVMPASSFAQTAADPGKMGVSPAADLTDGEVRKVDQETGKVTIKHGEIKHMDMPGMTMVFTAKDKALLASVKAGDKVKFMVVNDGGKMVLTDIKPIK